MPLTPATTDKFLKVGLPGSATTLSAPGYTIGNPSINVGATTNWSTDTPIVFAMDSVTVVNGVATRTPGTYCEFFGIVTGSGTIGNLSLLFGNAQNYVAGSLTRVYIPVSGSRENMLIDGMNQDHNGKGNHKNLTDDNGNVFLGRTQVASAVNYLAAANSIAGSPPSLSAAGADTNIDIQINPKGTGVAKIQGAVPQKYFASWNFIESGCVWSPDAPGSTRNASMTAGFVWINGKRLTVAAVTARTFVASNDTYVDFKDNGDGTASVTYGAVANNAASPALASSGTFFDTLRCAIIIAGATNIASAAAGVNNGQMTASAPVISGATITVNDSIGNLIGNRSPLPRLLGYRNGANTSVGAGGQTLILGTTCPVVLPNTQRRIKAMLNNRDQYNNTGSQYSYVFCYNNTDARQVGAGSFSNAGTTTVPSVAFGYDTPSTTTPTFSGQISSPGSGTANVEAPVALMVEID